MKRSCRTAKPITPALAGMIFLFAAVSLRSADEAVSAAPLVWDFAGGFQGWQPANWEKIETVSEGLSGISAYDCQLLSPRLMIRAEDYELLVVRLRSDTTGRGEVFVKAPGENLSDKRKIVHTLEATDGFRICRFPLCQNPSWSGLVERIRFDPLNQTGVRLDIDFIALLPKADEQLVNGDLEMVVDHVPLEWYPPEGISSGQAVITDAPLSGKHALRLEPNVTWRTGPVDLSFLGRHRVTGGLRGKDGEMTVTVNCETLDGLSLAPSEVRKIPVNGVWRQFDFEFVPPERAARAWLCFTDSGKEPVDLDAVHVTRLSKGAIVATPPPAPAWQASWIWHPDAVDRDNCTVWLRRRFTCERHRLRSAQLQLTVDDEYAAFLNGEEISRTLGQTDAWRTPQFIDVTAHLRDGDNELLLEAKDLRSAQGALAELVMVDEQQEEVWVRSGADWEAALNPAGPWVTAVAEGTPPCPPWGNVAYRPMGRIPRVSVKAALDTEPGANAPLFLRVKLTAADPVVHPIGLTAVIRSGETVLKRNGYPRLLFAGGSVPAGSAASTEDWLIPRPFGATAALNVELEILGAQFAEPPPQLAVPPGREVPGEGFPRAEIERVGRVPRIRVNGQPVDATQILFIRPDERQQRNALGTGVPIWSVSLNDMGFTENGFDFSGVDATLSAYLEVKPDAWLIPTFTFDTRCQRWWIEAHPEARCRLENGDDVIGDYHGGRRIVPSYGSRPWRETYGEALRQLIRHLRQSPFAGRIIGFHPASGISWEWFHWGSQSGELVDYSDAGQEDFRRWLCERYQTDTALQSAWHRPEITLQTASVPSEERRRHPGCGIYYDPHTQQDILDYHRYQHDVVADTIRFFGRIVKEETDGAALYGTYYGYTMHLPESPGFCQGSGHFSLYRLLAAPEIDFLMAPVAYSWREVGGTAATMTVAESAALNGKLFWNQADLRSHWSEQTGHGRPDDLAGSVACMHREVARNLAHGTAIQWYDFSLGWTLGDERLCQEVKRLYEINRVRERGDLWPLSDYLAVIVDEEQMGTFDPFHPPYGLSLIYRQREALERAGIPWKAYLFSDLKTHPELLEHRVFLFLNLFRLDGDERGFLKQNVMQAGRTIVFVGPVGMLDGKNVDARNTGEFLGLDTIEAAPDLCLQAAFLPSLPEPWSECSGKTYGIAHAFPPVAVPKDKPDRILAAFADQTPALLQVRHAACEVFWSVAPGLPTAALRSLALPAGVPILCSGDDAVYAGHGVVGIHARGNGSRTIVVPGKGSVYELLGRTDFRPTADGLQIDLCHGETRIFSRK